MPKKGHQLHFLLFLFSRIHLCKLICSRATIDPSIRFSAFHALHFHFLPLLLLQLFHTLGIFLFFSFPLLHILIWIWSRDEYNDALFLNSFPQKRIFEHLPCPQASSHFSLSFWACQIEFRILLFLLDTLLAFLTLFQISVLFQRPTSLICNLCHDEASSTASSTCQHSIGVRTEWVILY